MESEPMRQDVQPPDPRAQSQTRVLGHLAHCLAHAEVREHVFRTAKQCVERDRAVVLVPWLALEPEAAKAKMGDVRVR
jgi:hypothetical protein